MNVLCLKITDQSPKLYLCVVYELHTNMNNEIPANR